MMYVKGERETGQKEIVEKISYPGRKVSMPNDVFFEVLNISWRTEVWLSVLLEQKKKKKKYRMTGLHDSIPIRCKQKGIRVLSLPWSL